MAGRVGVVSGVGDAPWEKINARWGAEFFTFSAKSSTRNFLSGEILQGLIGFKEGVIQAAFRNPCLTIETARGARS